VLEVMLRRIGVYLFDPVRSERVEGVGFCAEQALINVALRLWNRERLGLSVQG
jgi:hypothetical protein